jgi:hypothetical protein
MTLYWAAEPTRDTDRPTLRAFLNTAHGAVSENDSLDGGADTLEEEFGFQEDLTVRDGNDVGRLYETIKRSLTDFQDFDAQCKRTHHHPGSQ